MATATLILEHYLTKRQIQAPIGFSWTVLFFGPCPALFRSDWSGFFLMLVWTIITGGYSRIYFMFTYNRAYLMKRIGKGYRAISGTQPIENISAFVGYPIPEAKITRKYYVEPDKKINWGLGLVCGVMFIPFWILIIILL